MYMSRAAVIVALAADYHLRMQWTKRKKKKKKPLPDDVSINPKQTLDIWKTQSSKCVAFSLISTLFAFASEASRYDLWLISLGLSCSVVLSFLFCGFWQCSSSLLLKDLVLGCNCQSGWTLPLGLLEERQGGCSSAAVACCFSSTL